MARDWIKLRRNWFGSLSHSELDGYALHLGPFLLVLADADPEWRERGSARIMKADGTPHTTESIAKLARVRHNACTTAARRLHEVGTMATDEEGFLYFPNYRSYQEDGSAKRKRKQRASVTVTPPVTGEVEVEVELPPKSPKGDSKKSRKTWRPTAAERAQCAEVLERMSELARRRNPRARGWSADSDANCRELTKRLRDGETVETLLAGVEARYAENGPAKWFSPTTPFRDSNWPMTVALIGTTPNAPSEKRDTSDVAIGETFRHPTLGWQVRESATQTRPATPEEVVAAKARS